ncbi:flagellar M-ring protein FliF [Pontivivens ytuae]|uniref:Flagellar M-ring protein n=1 Tax=Pontivivens ytuae TaxID=2789856 RepID=A0A7S9LQL9_9RHOB|nr:flagellar M-ring protein FliF [Pontivivens ytuae]
MRSSLPQIFERLDALSSRARLIAAGAAIAVFVAVLMLARIAAAPQMALLYSGLDGGAAAEVIEALERRETRFDVRGNAIYVPETERDTLRLSLAGEGLPAQGGVGYELLDSLSGFGTTSQMFDAAYRRAQEGELARTIVASPAIRAARVHLAMGEDGPFRRGGARTSASVTLTPARGGLNVAQADAVRHLVASSVPGLDPADVSVIDAAAGVVISSSEDGLAQSMSDSRADTLRQNVQRLLEARVGAGRAIVEVSVETDPDSETVTERVIDPESRVAIHSDVEEDIENADGPGPGAVTVASNLPDGDAARENDRSTREVVRTRERTNYEVSEVLRERVRAPGQVRRMSIAVLVDGIVEIAPDGTRNWTPRGEEELETLAELVRSATGFDAARGDQLTVQSLEFPEPGLEGTTAGNPGLIGGTISAMSLVQYGLLAVVALVLGLFVLRPMLMKRTDDDLQLIETEELPALAVPEDAQQDAARALAANPEMAALEQRVDPPLTRLRETIEERADESSSLLRSWMEADLAEENPA